VNPHLVRPPRLQPAFHQGEVAELLQHLDVRHGPLAVRPAPPPAVASISGQGRFNRHRPGLSPNEGQVPPFDRVGLELFGQVLLRRLRSGEDHEPGRVPVDPMDGPD
jgi:hypothetical protein